MQHAAIVDRDRARRAGQIVRLVHVQSGGVLVRTGQTEGSVDLSRLAGRHADPGLGAGLAQDGQQIGQRQRDAALGRCVVAAGDVQEDRTTRAAPRRIVSS